MSDYDSTFDPSHVSTITEINSQNSEEFHTLLVLGYNLTMKHGFFLKLKSNYNLNCLLDRENI